MTPLVNQDAIYKLIKEIVVDYLQANKPLPRTVQLNERWVQKDYFHSKSPEWIRTFIFDVYPETDEANGGWVINPRRTVHGRTTSIWLQPAIKWLDKHEQEIDWNAQLPS